MEEYSDRTSDEDKTLTTEDWEGIEKIIEEYSGKNSNKNLEDDKDVPIVNKAEAEYKEE